MTIGYVVACWFDARRNPQEGMQEDPLFNIKQHVEALNTLKHSIEATVFVFNNDGTEAFPWVLRSAQAYIRENLKTNFYMIEHDNVGISYGAWEAGMQFLGRNFDYTILLEDDYVPILNNFDRAFIDIGKDDPNVFYVCQLDSLNFKQALPHRHAAISNGVIKNKMYWDVYDARGEGFNFTPSGGCILGHEGDLTSSQIHYLDNFFEAGYEMKDLVGTDYRVLYNARIGFEYTVFTGINVDGIDILMPIVGSTGWTDVYENNIEIRTYQEWLDDWFLNHSPQSREYRAQNTPESL